MYENTHFGVPASQASTLGSDIFKQILDEHPVNTMLCDRSSFIITYANKATVETLRELQHLIPCKAEEVVGKCIDIFHKNPMHQRGLLSNPANLPHTAQIALGDETLNLNIFSLKDASGNDSDILVTWARITEKVRAEADAARLVQMIENMPVNVMLAEPKGFRITYMNRKSVEMLRKLEPYLPVKVDEILGRSIDVFHKNPAHQRALLADPANLPHHARIKLGPETLELHAAAIMDKNGVYIGPMVVWSVVTEQMTLAGNVNRVMEGVSGIAGEIRSASGSLKEVAAGTAKKSSILAAAAEDAAQNVNMVAAATEELTASVEEISRQASHTVAIANSAVSDTGRANETMKGLSMAAQKIGEVVSLINAIASQTNLLALNATIEAARAGEMGKGFAVVAAEVKTLANQTAGATSEISSQIQAIQGATGEAASAMKGIMATIGDINVALSAIAAAVEEQGASTREISRSIQQAAAGTHEVSSTVSDINRAAEETAGAATQLQGAASSLGEQSADLSGLIADFMRRNE